jgi:pantetheine-phosphate adenylyltransferase
MNDDPYNQRRSGKVPLLIAKFGRQAVTLARHPRSKEAPMARTGFYPGSFDPLTYGHLDVIARAARLVDRLVIAVGVHHGKQGMLALDERMAVLGTATRAIAEHTGLEISLTTFDDLAVDAARREGAGIILRGLRDATDFDYEVQMGQMNAAMAPTSRPSI